QRPDNCRRLRQGYRRREVDVERQRVKPAEYYREQRIELTLGTRATALDAGKKVVALESGERVAYDRLLVATGGRNRTVSVPGAQLGGIFQLRTVGGCDRIRAAAQRG